MDKRNILEKYTLFQNYNYIEPIMVKMFTDTSYIF